MYICNRRKFKTLAEAQAYANRLHQRTGIVAGIEQI